LRIQDKESGETYVDHTWDLTQLTEGRDPEYVTEGRIGIRLMGGHKIFMKDFKVEQLPPLQ